MRPRRLTAPPCPLCGAREPRPLARAGGRDYLDCPACGLAFLHPGQRPTPEEERAEYALHRNDPADAGYRRHLAKLVEPLAARLPPGARGLDYGCGPGPTLSAMMAERGFAVRDYDPLFRPDPAALAATYDFVACTETAEHFHDPARELRTLDRLLRPGGLLGLMTRLLDDATDFARWSYIRERSHVVFYRPRTVEWIAAEHGWSAEILAPDVAILAKG